MKVRDLKKLFIDLLFLLTNCLLFHSYIDASRLSIYMVYGSSAIYSFIGYNYFLKKENFKFYAILFIGFIIMCMRAIVYGTFGQIVLANILTCTIIGIVILNNGLRKVFQLAFMVIVFLYISYLYMIGFEPSELLPSLSYNHISVLLLYSTVLFYLSYDSKAIQQRHYHIWPALVCCILCVLSLGRSGIISSAFLLISLIILKFKYSISPKKNLSKLKATILLASFGGIIIYMFNYFAKEGYFMKFNDRGLKSDGRNMIIDSYFHSLDTQNLLIGNQSNFFEEKIGLTAHISYLTWHNFFGASAFLLIIYVLYSIIKYFKCNKYYMSLLIVILFRSLTDDLLMFKGIMFGTILVIFLIGQEGRLLSQ